MRTLKEPSARTNRPDDGSTPSSASQTPHDALRPQTQTCRFTNPPRKRALQRLLKNDLAWLGGNIARNKKKSRQGGAKTTPCPSFGPEEPEELALQVDLQAD